jgi:hypothetical protein
MATWFWSGNRAVWCLALACASLVQAGEIQPEQTQKCNDPPPALTARAGQANGAEALISGLWLKPGATRTTAGTDTQMTPEADGETVFSSTRVFSISTSNGEVSGRYLEKIVGGIDGFCKCQLRIVVDKGCLSGLAIHQILHPLKLVADYRRDLGGQVPSKSAWRSDDGSIVGFKLARALCAGESSRWLMLNTSVESVDLGDALELVAADGMSSTLLPLHTARGTD